MGNTNGMAYDGQDHVVVSATPKLEISYFGYNSDNNLVSQEDPEG